MFNRSQKAAIFFAISSSLLISCQSREKLDASVDNLVTSVNRASEDAIVHGARALSLLEKIENWTPPRSGASCLPCLSTDSLQARNSLNLGSKEDLQKALEHEQRESKKAQQRINELCRQLIEETTQRETRYGVKKSLPKACEA